MNKIALDFIKQHEGCKLSAYKDQAGVWTIGYGSTGASVVSGLIWTQEQADERLASDLSAFEVGVRKLLKRPLSDKPCAALISFAYNLGLGALSGSHLLQCVNSGDDVGAAKAFLVWDHIGQQEVKGLLIRRLEEAALYLRGI